MRNMNKNALKLFDQPNLNNCNLHIDKAGLKANETFFAIKRNISNLNRVAKLNLFKSMINPVILYASPCFGLNKYVMPDLETIQRRAVKWICVNNVPYKENLNFSLYGKNRKKVSRVLNFSFHKFSKIMTLEIQRATMKRLLNMAVSKVYFKCNDSWYVQVDGLAMGASLAQILANLWLKEYEFALRQQIPVVTGVQQINDKNGLCPCCSRKVTYRSKGLNARVAETGII